MADPVPHVTFHTSSGEPVGPDLSTLTPRISSSDLPGYIQSVPWEPGFKIGAGNGVNAVTGQIEASGVLPFAVRRSEVKHSLEFFRTIRYESNLAEALSADAGITLNIGQLGLGVGASSSLLSLARASATSFTIIATYTTTYKDFDLASEYTLRPEALEVVRDSPAEFRQRYGDYFVAGGQRSSTFTALLIYSCSNLESLTEFGTRINANLHDLFKVDGSAEWAKEAREAGVELEVYVEMRGYRGSAPGGPWDALKVVEALNWFRANEIGDYSDARLQHYSTLNFNIPRSIPIPGIVFEEIRELHVHLRSIKILSGSCPETEERSSLARETTELCQKVNASQGSLAVDSAMRAGFIATSNGLYGKLDDIHRRYRFRIHVQNHVSSQPTARIVAAKNQKIWSYGFSDYPLDSIIKIETTRDRIPLGPTLSPMRRDRILSYEGSRDRLVVGWKVISHRMDGHNGSWRRLAKSMLLSHSARVTIRTDRFRGADWELVTYHVEAQLYRFSATGEGDSDMPTKDYMPLLQEIRAKQRFAGMGSH